MKANGLITLLLLAGCNGPPQQQPVAQAPEVSSLPVGRFTIVHSPQVERDTMLLDTMTGETWELVTLGKSENSGYGWQAVNRLDGAPPVSNNSK